MDCLDPVYLVTDIQKASLEVISTLRQAFFRCSIYLKSKLSAEVNNLWQRQITQTFP